MPRSLTNPIERRVAALEQENGQLAVRVNDLEAENRALMEKFQELLVKCKRLWKWADGSGYT